MTTDQLHPYDDAEVPPVIRRLLADRELLGFLAAYDSPRLHALAPALTRLMTRRKLARILGDVGSIRDFQKVVESYVRRIIDRSMTTFEDVGVDRLERDRAYVFISNHRDIAGDSMLVNYSLHRAGFNTVRIAVGDNLVQKPFATDLMKLNKSFFIKRSGETRREVYNALLESSQYINDSISAGHSIWIAQAGGRAKDGVDLTDPAVVKMLTLGTGRRDFGEAIDSLSIVPVSLSYEFDPCDTLKARELAAIARDGRYEKQPGEDLTNLARGLTGFKGRVRLVFGEVLTGAFTSPSDVAAALDRVILENLELYPINFAAVRELASHEPESEYAAIDVPRLDDGGELQRRCEACDPGAEMFLRRMYANPVLTRHRYGIPLDPRQ